VGFGHDTVGTLDLLAPKLLELNVVKVKTKQTVAISFHHHTPVFPVAERKTAGAFVRSCSKRNLKPLGKVKQGEGRVFSLPIFTCPQRLQGVGFGRGREIKEARWLPYG